MLTRFIRSSEFLPQQWFVVISGEKALNAEPQQHEYRLANNKSQQWAKVFDQSIEFIGSYL